MTHSLACDRSTEHWITWRPQAKLVSRWVASLVLAPSLLLAATAGKGVAQNQQEEDAQLIREGREKTAGPVAGSRGIERWQDAKFGLFIHWGLYSLPAGVWRGQDFKGKYAEHIQLAGKIPVADYARLAEEFNPRGFNAEEWISRAKRAGMRYVVFVSKHQDGFAMFNSRVSDFNIVAATPFKRDPMKELAEAARAQGLLMGAYYSHARDHHHPLANWNKYGNTWDFPPRSRDDFVRYLNEKAKPQIEELLTGYGELATMWFDVPYNIPVEESEAIVGLVRRLQPNCVVNSRVGGTQWDYQSLGDNQISQSRLGGPWETCMTMNDSWGYHQLDQHWKSAGQIIRHLVDIVSKGGNLLLNVGPKADGTFPAEAVTILDAIGDWMSKNAQSIHGSRPAPFEQPGWGRITAHGKTLYLHVFDWPSDGVLAWKGSVPKVRRATLLANGREVRAILGGQSLALEVSAELRDPVDTVIALEIE